MKIGSYRVSAPEYAKEFRYASDRILVTAPFHMECQTDEGIDIKLSLDLDREMGRIVCRSISLSRPAAGTEITSSELREVAIATLVKWGGDQMIRVRGTSGEWVTLGGAGTAFAPAAGRERHEVVADAAVVYAVSALTARAPLQLVADRLGVSQSTATRLVSQARQDGLLSDG